MHIEPRLLVFTKGVRGRIAAAVALGLFSVGMGVARLGLLGWLIGQVFAGKGPADLLWPIAAIALVMVLRGVSEHWRAVTAHETAARVQKNLHRILYDKIASLGPATIGRQRSGALTLSMIDGVEQLETYFGQFLPQFLIALLSPILIFAVVSFIDLPVALVMLGFALLALFAPALWHKWDVRNSHHRQRSYASFAAEFLDSIQGLATLKAFGQGKTRADKLGRGARSVQAHHVGAGHQLAGPWHHRFVDRGRRGRGADLRRHARGIGRDGAFVLADHFDAGCRDLPADARAALGAAPGH